MKLCALFVLFFFNANCPFDLNYFMNNDVEQSVSLELSRKSSSSTSSTNETNTSYNRNKSSSSSNSSSNSSLVLFNPQSTNLPPINNLQEMNFNDSTNFSTRSSSNASTKNSIQESIENSTEENHLTNNNTLRPSENILVNTSSTSTPHTAKKKSSTNNNKFTLKETFPIPFNTIKILKQNDELKLDHSSLPRKNNDYTKVITLVEGTIFEYPSEQIFFSKKKIYTPKKWIDLNEVYLTTLYLPQDLQIYSNEKNNKGTKYKYKEDAPTTKASNIYIVELEPINKLIRGNIYYQIDDQYYSTGKIVCENNFLLSKFIEYLKFHTFILVIYPMIFIAIFSSIHPFPYNMYFGLVPPIFFVLYKFAEISKIQFNF